jgi:hypothetical protein
MQFDKLQMVEMCHHYTLWWRCARLFWATLVLFFFIICFQKILVHNNWTQQDFGAGKVTPSQAQQKRTSWTFTGPWADLNLDLMALKNMNKKNEIGFRISNYLQKNLFRATAQQTM